MKITGTTKIYGIIGHPITHTLSPTMHNAAFEAARVDGVYLPFPVLPEKLETVIHTLPHAGVLGLNVTLPHKQTVLPMMDTLSDEARLICAVNTIVYKDGKRHGHNTDGAGFLRSLEEDGKFKAKGKRALILGAGGAARAVAGALAKAGVRQLLIYNRTRDRAELLVKHIDHHFSYCAPAVLEEYQTRSKEDLQEIDLVVNATSLGLKKSDPIPISPLFFKKGTLFYDLIYHGETAWLKAAQKSKMETLCGLGMLLYQGALSFELWTGKKAPASVMRNALRKQICS